MTTHHTTIEASQRLALLETMLVLRASRAVAAGEEAASAGLAPALERLGPLRPLLQVRRMSPWQDPSSADALAAAHDVEAVFGAAMRLAAAIIADGRPRLLALAASATSAASTAAAQLTDDGADAEEHAAWSAADPVALHTARLLAEGVVGPGELLHLHQRALASAAAAQPLRRAA